MVFHWNLSYSEYHQVSRTNLIIILLLYEVLTPGISDGFHWSLSASKSPQMPETFLSILANLNNAEVWILSTCPHISKSSRPLTNLLGIVPSASITIGITVTLILLQDLDIYLFS